MLKVVKVGLSCEATDVVAVDGQGNSALHFLAAQGRTGLLKPFFKALRKADKASQGPTLDLISLSNEQGQTAEDLAQVCGHDEVPNQSCSFSA